VSKAFGQACLGNGYVYEIVTADEISTHKNEAK